MVPPKRRFPKCSKMHTSERVYFCRVILALRPRSQTGSWLEITKQKRTGIIFPRVASDPGKGDDNKSLNKILVLQKRRMRVGLRKGRAADGTY